MVYLRRILSGKDPDSVVVLVDDVHVRLQVAEVRLGFHHVGRVASLAVTLLLESARSWTDTDARGTKALEVRLLRVLGRRRLDRNQK